MIGITAILQASGEVKSEKFCAAIFSGISWNKCVLSIAVLCVVVCHEAAFAFIWHYFLFLSCKLWFDTTFPFHFAGLNWNFGERIMSVSLESRLLFQLPLVQTWMLVSMFLSDIWRVFSYRQSTLIFQRKKKDLSVAATGICTLRLLQQQSHRHPISFDDGKWKWAKTGKANIYLKTFLLSQRTFC